MSRVCELTGIKAFSGNKVSHSNIKTRTKWMPNLKGKKYLIPELSQTISLKLSTRAIRTIDKLGGITPAILAAKPELLSTRIKSIKAKILKKRGSKKTAAAKTA